jgi:glucose-fructose oxidoreductase
VDEGAVALIRFPDERLAHLHTSFGEEPAALCTLLGEEGYLRLHRGYDIAAEARLEIVRRGRREEMTFDRADEFVAELAQFSQCVREDREPELSGFEGLLDVRIVEAIYRSARDGRPVTRPRVTRSDPAVADPRARDSA